MTRRSFFGLVAAAVSFVGLNRFAVARTPPRLEYRVQVPTTWSENRHVTPVYDHVGLDHPSRFVPSRETWWEFGPFVDVAGLHALQAGQPFRLVDPRTGVVVADAFESLNPSEKERLRRKLNVRESYSIYLATEDPTCGPLGVWCVAAEALA